MSITHTTDEELRLKRRVQELEKALKEAHRLSMPSSLERPHYKLGLIHGLTRFTEIWKDDEEPT